MRFMQVDDYVWIETTGEGRVDFVQGSPQVDRAGQPVFANAGAGGVVYDPAGTSIGLVGGVTIPVHRDPRELVRALEARAGS
jgi:hypothetical protein